MKKDYLFGTVILTGLFLIAFIFCLYGRVYKDKGATIAHGQHSALVSSVTLAAVSAGDVEDDFTEKHLPKSKLFFIQAPMFYHQAFAQAPVALFSQPFPKTVSSKLILHSVFRI